MFRGDEDTPLGPFLGNLPSEVLRLVLGNLTPFDRALFARASDSCFRACERSGLGRAGVDRQDRGQAVKASEMVVSLSMFQWTRRDSGLDEGTIYRGSSFGTIYTGRFFSSLNAHKVHVCVVKEAARTAAILGDLDYFKCVLLARRGSTYASYDPEWNALYHAARNGDRRHGQKHIIMWALANGLSAKANLCESAAGSGRLDLLKWLRQKGCPWGSDTCSSAASGGHLEVLRWAHDNGCPWDWSTCSDAASGGHLEVLRWARDHGCPWNEETCASAAIHGHLEVLRWARDHGCPCHAAYLDA